MLQAVVAPYFDIRESVEKDFFVYAFFLIFSVYVRQGIQDEREFLFAVEFARKTAFTFEQEVKSFVAKIFVGVCPPERLLGEIFVDIQFCTNIFCSHTSIIDKKTYAVNTSYPA